MTNAIYLYPSKPVESSNIKDFAYNETEKVLVVEFKRRDNATSIYTYNDVPKKDFDALCSAESVGKVFNFLIRDKYKFNHLSETEAHELGRIFIKNQLM